MKVVTKQDKETLEVQMITLERTWRELNGRISIDYETAIRYLKEGAILQTLFYTYKIGEPK
jgi:hypothetical protein